MYTLITLRCHFSLLKIISKIIIGELLLLESIEEERSKNLLEGLNEYLKSSLISVFLRAKDYYEDCFVIFKGTMTVIVLFISCLIFSFLYNYFHSFM